MPVTKYKRAYLKSSRAPYPLTAAMAAGKAKRQSTFSKARSSVIVRGSNVGLVARTRPLRGFGQPIVLSRGLDSKGAFPDKIRMTLCTTMAWYNAAASLTAAAGNYVAIRVNSIYQPFNSATYTPTTGTGTATFAQNATLVQGFALANNPLNYTNLSAMYQYYRVYKYEIEITMQPNNAADACRLIMIPLGNEEIPSAAAGNVDIRVLESQAFSQGITVFHNGSSANNTIKMLGVCNRDLGLDYSQYKNQGQTVISGAPPTTLLDYVGIFTQILSGANSAGTASYQCVLKQYVELSGLNAEID